MDVTTPIRPADLFSAKGLVVVITGGGSGTSLELRATPPSPAPSRPDMCVLEAYGQQQAHYIRSRSRHRIRPPPEWR
ncbi:hypothetical protein IG631_15735 [Alternaria alternata]|nr:hypothetical protein IG631_15735 [Alternaria alternata]